MSSLYKLPLKYNLSAWEIEIQLFVLTDTKLSKILYNIIESLRNLHSSKSLKLQRKPIAIIHIV